MLKHTIRKTWIITSPLWPQCLKFMMTCFLPPTPYSRKLTSDMKIFFRGYRKKFDRKTWWTWLCSNCSSRLFMQLNITWIFQTASSMKCFTSLMKNLIISKVKLLLPTDTIRFLSKSTSVFRKFLKDWMSLRPIKYLHQKLGLLMKEVENKNKSMCNGNQS